MGGNIFSRVAVAFLFATGFFFLAITAVAGESVDFLDDAFYEEQVEAIDVNDPLEPFNRFMFDVNDVAYTWVLDPVARGYSKIMPYDFRILIYNFFYNLEEPVRSINALLQGRFNDSGVLASRFVINTLFGLAGLGDPAASEFDLNRVGATLGQTLEFYGLGDGFYLVVPLFGATTLRDFTGTVIDGLSLTPYYMWTDELVVQGGIYFGKETNKLTFHLGQYEELKKLSFDPYVALRNGYMQHRRKMRDEPFVVE